MISDCGWRSPEKYLFRLGLITAAGLLARASKIVRDYIDHVGRRNGTQGSLQDTTVGDVTVWLATIASCGLAGCAAISEEEDNPIHSASALVFFILYLVYMWIVCFRIQQQGVGEGKPWGSGAHNLRIGLASLCTVALLGFLYLNIIKAPYDPDCAFTEWTGTLAIIFYNFSFRSSFSKNGKVKVFTATLYDSSERMMCLRNGVVVEEEVPKPPQYSQPPVYAPRRDGWVPAPMSTLGDPSVSYEVHPPLPPRYSGSNW